MRSRNSTQSQMPPNVSGHGFSSIADAPKMYQGTASAVPYNHIDKGALAYELSSELHRNDFEFNTLSIIWRVKSAMSKESNSLFIIQRTSSTSLPARNSPPITLHT